MPADNIIHYILYLAILIGFFVVLKSPKKKDDSQSKEDVADKNSNDSDTPDNK